MFCNQRPPYVMLIAVAALCIAGCGGKSELESVAGNVTYQNSPLSKGVVTFYPVTGRPVIAPLSAEGNYKAELAPGDYVVTIEPSSDLPPGAERGGPLPPALVLPPEYSTRAQSKLSASVAEGQAEPINFDLK